MNFMKWSFTVVACLLVLGALAAWKILDIQAAIAAAEAYPEPSETVEVTTVATAEFSPSVTVMGEIIAPQRLDLRNEIAGAITVVNFESGGRVRAGQVLLQLDIAVEEANLEAARAHVQLAEVVHERNRKLFETRVINEDQLDRSKAELAAAVAAARVLERTIEKLTLRAPFDGRASLHNFEVGQFLSANTLIATLVGDSDELWVDFQLPQFYPGLAAGAEVGMLAIGTGAGATPVAARIIAENPVLNASNRSRGYRASIANDGQLAPHTMVQMQVPVAEPQQLLQVPALAVQSDPLGQYVYLLRRDEAGNGFRAVRQQVQVRVVEADRALLENGTGLAQGDMIAAAGAFKLREGLLVFTRDRSGAGRDTPAGSAPGNMNRDAR